MRKPAFVYVIAVGGDDGPFKRPVKIGITTDKEKRLAAIRPNSPLGISFAFVKAVPSFDFARFVERAVHQIFKDSRIDYEWFDVEPDAAADMVAKMADAEAYFGR